MCIHTREHFLWGTVRAFSFPVVSLGVQASTAPARSSSPFCCGLPETQSSWSPRFETNRPPGLGVPTRKPCGPHGIRLSSHPTQGRPVSLSQPSARQVSCGRTQSRSRTPATLGCSFSRQSHGRHAGTVLPNATENSCPLTYVCGSFIFPPTHWGRNCPVPRNCHLSGILIPVGRAYGAIYVRLLIASNSATLQLPWSYFVPFSPSLP